MPGVVSPKIISLGFAVPENRYTQESIFGATGYPSRFRKIFMDSGISHRYFAVPIEEARRLSFQEQQDLYSLHATQLSLKAALNCLDGRVPDIGLLTYASCTGFAPGPTIAHLLGKELALPHSVCYTNIGSMGCEGGAFPGFRRSYDFTVATGKPSLVIACELCSLSYFPEEEADPENDYELLRASAIFADAASCALIGFDEDPHHPYILGFQSWTDFTYGKELGYVWRNGRLRVRLSRKVPQYATEVTSRAVSELLREHNLSVDQIRYWIIHAAGLKVLYNIARVLGLSPDKLKHSLEALNQFGNCSSATVGIVGKLFMQAGEFTAGDYVVSVTVGPGMTGGASILRFPI